MNIISARYLYRCIPRSTDSGPWRVLDTCLNTREGHEDTIARWNRESPSLRAWRWDRTLPNDIDHKWYP